MPQLHLRKSLLFSNNLTPRTIISTFCLFAFLGLALAWQALAYPMVYDDLHLIREFTPQQLAASFTHNYDTDGFENGGLRPFMNLYNSARFEMFGENVVAHRLFLIGMFALFLTALCWIAKRFGLSWSWSLLAGVMLLTAKYSVNHYIWLTDGIHLFQGLLFTAATICLLETVRSPRWWLSSLSVLFTVIGVLTREDTLATVPVLILMGYVYAKHINKVNRRQLTTYASALIAVCIAFFALRVLFVPEAQSPGINISGFLLHVVLTPNFMGITAFDPLTNVLIWGWGIVALNLIVSKFIFRKNLAWGGPFLWLACALIACTPGLNVVRTNLLLFPMTFMALFFASALSEIARISNRAKVFVTLTLCWLVAGEIYISSLTMQSFQPYSSTAIAWNSDFIYGSYAKTATIPAQRRDSIVEQLAKAGVRSESDALSFEQQTVPQLAAASKHTPSNNDSPFVPYLHGIDQP